MLGNLNSGIGFAVYIPSINYEEFHTRSCFYVSGDLSESFQIKKKMAILSFWFGLVFSKPNLALTSDVRGWQLLS